MTAQGGGFKIAEAMLLAVSSGLTSIGREGRDELVGTKAQAVLVEGVPTGCRSA